MSQHTNFLATVRILLIHLRLHFQVLLAPIFLWGYFLAGGLLTGQFWLAFVAFHIFLYGGTTAFNSYYDRDEGPVGGLAKPPPVVQALLPFSLIVQAIGAVLAFTVNLVFGLIYLIIFAMGFAYSHPRLRWKSRPLAGLLTVAVGQGVLAGLGGWAAANPKLSAFSPLAWLGLLAAALITVGFYPLTQIYQPDRRRPGAGRFDLCRLGRAAGCFSFCHRRAKCGCASAGRGDGPAVRHVERAGRRPFLRRAAGGDCPLGAQV
jgi:1,4-dihydroxy-2-naphthoate octaprenyltransferase